MGRFYNTDKSVFVDDIMYKAPYELMLNAINTQDQKITKDLEDVDAIEETAKLLKNVETDDPRKKELFNNLRNSVGDITNNILKAPGVSQRAAINNVKRYFQENITTGDLAQMDKEYKKRETFRTDIKKRTDITDKQKELVLKNADSNYTGVTKGSKYIEDMNVFEHIDETTAQGKFKALMTADSEAHSETNPDGKGYMIKVGNKTKYIRPDRVEKMFNTAPETLKWENEHKQIRDLKVANGELTPNEAKVEYETDREEFKQNTITALSYEQTGDEKTMSSDNAYWQRQNMGLAWSRFNEQRKKDAIAEVTITVHADEAGEGTLGDYGVYDENDGEGTKKLKIATYKAHKKALSQSLASIGVNSTQDFAQMSPQDRIKILKKLKAQDLYVPSSSQLTSIITEGINLTRENRTANSGDKDIRIKNRETVKRFNNITDPNERFRVEWTDANHVLHSEDMTVEEAYKRGFVNLKTGTRTVQVPKLNSAGLPTDSKGKVVQVPTGEVENGFPITRPVKSIEEAKKLGKLLTVDKKETYEIPGTYNIGANMSNIVDSEYSKVSSVGGNTTSTKTTGVLKQQIVNGKPALVKISQVIGDSSSKKGQYKVGAINY